MKYHSTALWFGSGKDGFGQLTTQSLALHQAQYSFASRFAHGEGSSPEEFLAVAHAGCYTMNLSLILSAAGFTVERLQTTAHVQNQNGVIVESHLEIIAEVLYIDTLTFEKCVENALNTCPVSNTLKAKVTTEYALVS